MTAIHQARRDRDISLVQAGGWALLVTSFVGRLPSSMVQLGYLMVLSEHGRGLALGGLAVAAVGLGSAIGAPLIGRLVDAWGPWPVVAAATGISVAAQAGFIMQLSHHHPSWHVLACAALVGAANPQIGPIVRSHWSHLAARLKSPTLANRALGHEGMVDEVGFVVGPALAGLLVSTIGSFRAALVMMALTAALQGLFLAHLWRDRAAWSTVGASRRVATDHGRTRWAVVWPMLACVGVGTLFGATQTGLTAMFSLRGTPAVTGFVYGCVGIGSAAASVSAARLANHLSASARVCAGGMLMLLAGWAMMLLPSMLAAAAVALVMGVGAGLSLVSSFACMERLAPRRRMATWMTVLATCTTVGVSSGAAIAGWLASNPSHSFWPVTASGALAVSAAIGMWHSQPDAVVR